jgi:hypothetical protein
MIRGATYGLSEAVKGFSYPKTVPTQSSAKIHMKKHQITGSQQQNKVVARNQLPRPCTWLTWQSKRTGQEGGHIIRRILVFCLAFRAARLVVVVTIVLRVEGQWRHLACWGKLGFLCWYVERFSVAHQVDGWILKESQMSLVVTPRTGNSGCRIWAFMLSADTVLDMIHIFISNCMRGHKGEVSCMFR